MHLWRTFFFTCLSIVLAVSAFFAYPAFAQDRCDCWCTSPDGAVQIDGQDEAETNTDCRDICSNGGLGYLSCYTSGSPDGNDRCWTQYECESTTLEEDGQEYAYEWADSQAPDCLPGERYCYQPEQTVDLNVAIGNIEEIDSLPEYINAVYNFLLPVGGLLAVLLLMIAGLQWMLARGNPTRIDKAKTRIRNAVTGIILLLLAVSMLELVDPRLTQLNRLTPPAIRTVVFIDENSTCENLADQGLRVEADIPGQEDCGDTGTVYPDAGSELLTEETTCRFTGCSNPFEVCASTTLNESGYDCLRCKDVYTTIDESVGAQPSSSMCNTLESRISDDDKAMLAAEKEASFHCAYYDAGVFDVTFNSCVEFVYPEEEDYLDCAELERYAKEQGSLGCRAYDLVQASYSYGPLAELLSAGDAFGADFDVGYINEVDDLEGADDFELLDQLCTNDPCNLAPPGETCKVFHDNVDYETISEEALDSLNLAEETALDLALTGSDIQDIFGGGLVLDRFANCANESSAYGFFYCKDVDGQLVDCNPTW